MSDFIIQKILVETASEIFSAPEKKQIKQLGETLRRAQERMSEADPSRLGRILTQAQDGLDVAGAPIADASERVKNIHKAQAALLEGPLHSNTARADERRVYSEARPYAHKLIAAAIAAAENHLARPPEIQLPALFAEWGLALDLSHHILGPIEDARRTLQWEIEGAHWSQSAPENGFNFLSRAGLFQ